MKIDRTRKLRTGEEVAESYAFHRRMAVADALETAGVPLIFNRGSDPTSPPGLTWHRHHDMAEKLTVALAAHGWHVVPGPVVPSGEERHVWDVVPHMEEEQ
jgi:hypothetical protein